MIQRIQTVYLFLAALCLVVMLFVPLSLHTLRGLEIPFELLQDAGAEELTASMMITIWPLLVGIVALAAIILLAIFLYANRKRQIHFTMAAVLLNMVVIIAVFWMARQLASALDPEAIDQVVEYQLGAYLPVGSLLLLILAHKAIRKDEQKVRAADRLR
jgi:glucan phosphoethanolaminetransferase (alkaline phosphatase superfamily)